jgi:fucose permease
VAGPEDMIHNEQIKLAATALNNIGVASVVTGVTVPLVGRALSAAPPASSRYWGWFVALWFMFGVGCHLLGRRALKELRP